MIIKSESGQIVYVSRLYEGTEFDYSILKIEFPPTGDWFVDKILNVDLGFQGIVDDYKAEKIIIPHKRKRVPKGESNELSTEKKDYNKKASALRIDIEHSIGQMKVCRNIHQVVRIKNDLLLDKVVLVAAGLANFRNSVKH